MAEIPVPIAVITIIIVIAIIIGTPAIATIIEAIIVIVTEEMIGVVIAIAIDITMGMTRDQDIVHITLIPGSHRMDKGDGGTPTVVAIDITKKNF